MPGTLSAPPVPRTPPDYGQTRNQQERGMWYPNGAFYEPGLEESSYGSNYDYLTHLRISQEPSRFKVGDILVHLGESGQTFEVLSIGVDPSTGMDSYLLQSSLGEADYPPFYEIVALVDSDSSWILYELTPKIKTALIAGGIAIIAVTVGAVFFSKSSHLEANPKWK